MCIGFQENGGTIEGLIIEGKLYVREGIQQISDGIKVFFVKDVKHKYIKAPCPGQVIYKDKK